MVGGPAIRAAGMTVVDMPIAPTYSIIVIFPLTDY